MSFGPFITSKYQDNGGGIHSIRIQPETLTLSIGAVDNGVPAGEVDNLRGVSASGKRSILHLGARRIGVRVTNDAGPYAVGTVHYVPVMTPNVFQQMIDLRGSAGTYNGSAVVCIGGSPERA